MQRKSSSLDVTEIDFYHPPMWIREGIAFSHVCLSFCLSSGGGSNVTIIHDALDLAVQDLPSNLCPSPFKHHTWDPPSLGANSLWTSDTGPFQRTPPH